MRSAVLLNLAITRRLAFLTLVFLLANPCFATEPAQFRAEELPVKLGVGYAVRAVDVNADDRLDIAIVDSKRVLWLENPSWKEHVISETPDAKFDNVCFAPHDINGDGRIDFALGADWQFGNSDAGGTIGWLEHTAKGPWDYHAIASEPTTHRMNWIDIDNNGKPHLVVGPLKGRGTRPPGFDQTGIRLLAFSPSSKPASEAWSQKVLTSQLHVMHNFEAVDLNDDKRMDIITASFEGVSWIQFPDSGADAGNVTVRRLGAGQEEAAPLRGASELRRGKLRDGRIYIATIEPWHGDKVVVYVAPDQWETREELWPRFVLDVELAWGHALACADMDGDGDEELVVGIRDDKGDNHRRGVRIYDPVDAVAGEWNRQIVDPGGVAVEDLVCADLDADGDQEIIAVGRATHNCKIYWHEQP